MKAVIISFTKCGCDLGEKLAAAFEQLGWENETYVKSRHVTGQKAKPVEGSLSDWMEEHWEKAESVVFVGATGVAVRTAAPFVKSKKTDPAVICMDEKGKFCIPLLSGHLGGANALADQLARYTGALPVITTATDLNDCFAVDLFAKEQGYEIQNMKQAKEMSAALLSGEPIVTVGVGCRRDTPAEEIQKAVEAACERNRIPLRNLKQLVSIDLKKDEQGILKTAEALGIPFRTYTAEELKGVEGEYTTSLFVQSVTGVDNVCERSAVLGSNMGILIQKKESSGPVTTALAIETKRRSK